MGGASSTEIGGVRVFRVSAGSPASEAGLEVFFDFITEVNGIQMDPSHHQTFAEKISECENGQAKMVVYNSRVHNHREVTVIPRKWGGSGLLGATVRYDTTEPGDSNGIRVLEVFPNSPAAHAGLVPFQDFLLGTASCVFRDIDELVEVVTASINKPMQVYVYNADSETSREVTLVPNNDWGGDGCIGCDIGTGLLHRIPPARRQPGNAAPLGVPPPVAAAVPPPVAAAVPPPLPAGVAAPPAVGMAVPPPASGIPAVPAVPSGLPGIATPAWNPSMMAKAPPGAGANVLAPALTPAATAPAQSAALGGVAPPMIPTAATAPAGAEAASVTVSKARGQVAGVAWPPPRQSQQEIAGADQASGGGGASPTPSTPGGSMEMPKAPPSTPAHGLDAANLPGVDLSSVMAQAGGVPQPGGPPQMFPTYPGAPLQGTSAVL